MSRIDECATDTSAVVQEQGTFTYARQAIPFAEINAMFKAPRAEA
jgi:hypothetical protein